MSVDVHGEAKVLRDIDALGKRARRPQPTERRLKNVVERSNARRFSANGFGEWSGLSDATLAKKAAQGQSSQPLRATGALQRAATSQVHVKYERDAFLFGIAVPYAAFHSYGTRYMPSRPVMELRQSDRQQAKDILSHYIATGHP